MKRKLQGKIPAIIRVLVVFLLVVLQIYMMFAISKILQYKTSYMYAVLEIISIIMVVLLINRDNTVAHKLGWIFIITFFPVTGFIMYLLWGSTLTNRSINKSIMQIFERGQRFQNRIKKIDVDKTSLTKGQKRLAQYLEKKQFVLYDNTRIKYFGLGDDAFKSIIKDLKSAKKYIFMEFFIVSEGKLWDEIHEVLVAKVKEGVEVRLLYDDWGSIITVSNHFYKELRSEGILVSIFNPVHKYLSKLYLNYRNHQKIVVVDGDIAYTGGINLADEYVNYYPKHGHWKDQAIKLEGDAVYGLLSTFLEMWEVSSQQKIADYTKYKGSRMDLKVQGYCQPFSDGPANNPENPARDSFLQIMNSATEYLYITTPYLVIDDYILEEIALAKYSGVDVRIITPSIPDHRYVQYITRYNYGKLLRAGVRIYEYTPGFMHSKMIINEEMGVIGSINMDYRSFYLHYECGVALYQKEVLNKAKKDFLNTLEVCEEMCYEKWLARPLWMKIFQDVLNLFSGLM